MSCVSLGLSRGRVDREEKEKAWRNTGLRGQVVGGERRWRNSQRTEPGQHRGPWVPGGPEFPAKQLHPGFASELRSLIRTMGLRTLACRYPVLGTRYSGLGLGQTARVPAVFSLSPAVVPRGKRSEHQLWN